MSERIFEKGNIHSEAYAHALGEYSQAITRLIREVAHGSVLSDVRISEDGKIQYMMNGLARVDSLQMFIARLSNPSRTTTLHNRWSVKERDRVTFRASEDATAREGIIRGTMIVSQDSDDSFPITPDIKKRIAPSESILYTLPDSEIHMRKLRTGEVVLARTQGKHEREQNEDAAGVGNTRVIIADGMGGTQGAGDVARFVTKKCIMHTGYLSTFQHYLQQYREEPILTSGGNTVYTACEIAHRGNEKMLRVLHRGTGAVYVLRDNDIVLVTPIHTLEHESLNPGVLRPSIRKMVTRSAFPKPHSQEPGESFYQEISVQRGNRVLMCSDGISKNCTEGEILACACSTHPRTAFALLFALATLRSEGVRSDASEEYVSDDRTLALFDIE